MFLPNVVSSLCLYIYIFWHCVYVILWLIYARFHLIFCLYILCAWFSCSTCKCPIGTGYYWICVGIFFWFCFYLHRNVSSNLCQNEKKNEPTTTRKKMVMFWFWNFFVTHSTFNSKSIGLWFKVSVCIYDDHIWLSCDSCLRVNLDISFLLMIAIHFNKNELNSIAQ